jgi:mannose-6-phosphate isomerase
MLYKLFPHIEEKIWGGDRLHKIFGLEPRKIGEMWTISTHKLGSSWIFQDGIKNKNLNEQLNLNYLVKLIETSSELSIQVHPNDHFAFLHEKSKGKTEC